jgi:hypothetical protein
MAEKKTLRIVSAFGPSRSKTLLLSEHPDESHDEEGNPRSDARTLILSLNGDRATFLEEQPMSLFRVWYSTKSGVAYCTSMATNKLHKWTAGKWSSEVFSESPVEVVRFIFGFAADDPRHDQLFLVAKELLFVRQSGTWKKHKLPKCRFPFQIHGRSPSEVFIGGETPYRWDGKRPQRFEDPDDDTLHAIWVTEDDRLVGGGTHMSITTKTGDWDRLKMPGKSFGMLMEFDGTLYVSDQDRGVARVLPQPGKIVSPPFEPLMIYRVGDGLIAISDDTTMVFDGKAWKPIRVPKCEVGNTP